MLESRKRSSFGSGVEAPARFGVVVAADGHLDFARAADRRQNARSNAVTAIAAESISAADQALIATNRARLAELKGQPYSTIPDFSDAVLGRIGESIRLNPVLVGWALHKLGAPDATVAAAIGALRLGRRWLEDHGIDPEPAPGAPGLFYGDLPGLAVWFLLDAFNRFAAAGSIDDTLLEDALDAYYPHWSRADFEWDPRRAAIGPVLNAHPEWLVRLMQAPGPSGLIVPAVRSARRRSSWSPPAARAPSPPPRSSARPDPRARGSRRATFRMHAPRSALPA